MEAGIVGIVYSKLAAPCSPTLCKALFRELCIYLIGSWLPLLFRRRSGDGDTLNGGFINRLLFGEYLCNFCLLDEEWGRDCKRGLSLDSTYCLSKRVVCRFWISSFLFLCFIAASRVNYSCDWLSRAVWASDLEGGICSLSVLLVRIEDYFYFFILGWCTGGD